MNKIIFLILGMVVFYGCADQGAIDRTIEETEDVPPQVIEEVPEVEEPKEETLDESSENYDYLDDALKSLEELE